jgi:magnesium-transporting ATPase (P-type)
VEGGRQLGFEFVKRVRDGVVLRMAGCEATFEVLNVMEYSSARGRMSVVVRAPGGAGRPVLACSVFRSALLAGPRLTFPSSA